jgi:co-chaperonin GroES (HSP10)
MADNIPTLEGTSWVAQSAGAFPEGALVVGTDAGNDFYVARAEHSGDIIPAKLIPAYNKAYVAWGSKEHEKEYYEVLVVPAESVSWVATTGANVPEKAIPGGISEDGEVLYVGRASHEGTVTVGKVQVSHGVLYISYGGAEVSYPEYEILVLN